MPTINLSPKVRFALYLIGALASLFVVYAVDKSWAGDAEVRLVSGIVALISLLAAANTDTNGNSDKYAEQYQATTAAVVAASQASMRASDQLERLNDNLGNGAERVGEAVGREINKIADGTRREGLS